MSESNGNKLASLEELVGGAPNRRYKIVTLPLLGLTVRIQSINEREFSQYQAALVSSGGRSLRPSRMEDANRRFIALCLVDKDGNRMLSGKHIARLSEWDAADAAFLYDECARHCGINQDDIEVLVKNSEEISDAV